MTTGASGRRLGAGLVAGLLLTTACATTLDRRGLSSAAPAGESAPAVENPSAVPSSGATALAAGGTPTATSTTGPDATSHGARPVTGGTSRQPGRGSTATPSSGGEKVRTSQGVTATTIKVGFMTTDAAGLQSVKGVNLGDNKVEAQAAVDWVNARGGVAGRKIVPVFVQFSAASDNWERDYQGFCTTFTEDQKVFAVVGNTIAYSKTFAHCLAQHNTPLINSAGGVQDRVGSAALGKFLYTPGSFELTRLTAAYVDGLQAAGFFGAGSTIGLIRVDDAPFARVTDEVLLPRLTRLGLKVKEQAVVAANESLSTTASQMPNIVLRFQQSNVNRVLVLDNGTLALSFSLAASSQGYAPRLGLNSMNNPILMQQNLPAQSLAGSVGVGWQPTGDVDALRDPSPNGPAKTCDQLNAAAGQGGVSRTGVWQQRMYCDGVFFLRTALAASTEITPTGLASGVASLGTSFASAMTWKTAFQPSRFDGAAGSRTFVYDTSCSCFRYTGGLRATA